MIRTKVTIAGTEYVDYKTLQVTRTISDYGASASFIITFDSPFGRHKSDFVVGNEIKIYADKDTAPVTIILTGIVENIVFEGEENTQTCTLSGRDYTARLMDVTVEPSVYTSSEISTIVTNIIDNFVSDITTTNVDVTETTLQRIAFNHTSVYEALRQLAELSGFYFYIDTNKDLHFEKREQTDSGITIDNSNILSMNFEKTREEMANKVWIYGDRYLTTAPREIFPVGASPGSVYTLAYRPHNTQVNTSSTRPGSNLIGGILGLSQGLSVSGTEYLVSFFDRQIVFISGTTLGYSTIPNANGSVVVSYERDVPIARYGQNNASIIAFGPKEKVIQDKSIKDPSTAQVILINELQNSDPFDEFTARLRGWFTFIPGQLIRVNLDDFGVDKSVAILQIDYTFTKDSIQNEDIISVVLNSKPLDLTDVIRDMQKRIDDLESADKDSTDTFTRVEFGIGSMLTVGSRWIVSQRYLGSEFRVWGNNNVAPTMSGGTIRLGILGSSTALLGSVSYLTPTDFTFNSYLIRASGGYVY